MVKDKLISACCITSMSDKNLTRNLNKKNKYSLGVSSLISFAAHLNYYKKKY
jgi:hypothetical protein